VFVPEAVVGALHKEVGVACVGCGGGRRRGGGSADRGTSIGIRAASTCNTHAQRVKTYRTERYK
ncbi:MAG: hypothetical protein ACXVI1_07940, partial [Halobacteriota archaeon]